jgi:hypothetical protein
MSVPLSYTELIRASHHYPIVFSHQGNPTPQALLSTKQDQNDFVDQNGRWLVPYIPAHVRRYPFILAKADEAGNYAVCIDTDAPLLSSEQGDPLYTANGEPTDFLNRTVEFLKRYQQEMLQTEKLFTELQNKQLFVEKTFNRAGEAETNALTGFRIVDVNRLKEMDSQSLSRWVKNGFLGLIYAHIHSLDNLREDITTR